MSDDKHPFVSIIFPNWNGKDDVLECLNSLRRLEYPKKKLEIVIIDNGSNDGSQKAIRQKFSEMNKKKWFSLKLIENKKNMGPTVARNQGIKSAYEDHNYIWMMDNDIVVDKNALKEMLKVVEYDSNIGIVGSTNYYYDDPHKICSSGGMINWKKGITKNVIGKNLKGSNILKVESVFGCSLLIKKELIQRLGLFDQDYFCYFNDTDLCVRAKKAGYEIIVATFSKVWHKISHSTINFSGFKKYFMTKSRIILIRKNANLLNFLYFFTYLFLLYLPWESIKTIFRKKISDLIYMYRGVYDGFFLKKSHFYKRLISNNHKRVY
jgi:GT2 family glycosyltransferase